MHVQVDRIETIRSDGRPCPCGGVSVVTICSAAAVNLIRNGRNGAFDVVQCDEVVEGSQRAYRVGLQRIG